MPWLGSKRWGWPKNLTWSCARRRVLTCLWLLPVLPALACSSSLWGQGGDGAWWSTLWLYLAPCAALRGCRGAKTRAGLGREQRGRSRRCYRARQGPGASPTAGPGATCAEGSRLQHVPARAAPRGVQHVCVCTSGQGSASPGQGIRAALPQGDGLRGLSSGWGAQGSGTVVVQRTVTLRVRGLGSGAVVRGTSGTPCPSPSRSRRSESSR